MASKPLLNALTNKYAELLGKYQAAEREIETVTGLKNIQEATERIDAEKAELEIGMDHIDYVARMFDPTWDRRRIKAKPPRQKMVGWRGTKVRMVIEILREADGPLTARQIAHRMFSGPAKPTVAEITALENSVRPAMKRAVAKGLVIQEPGSPMRWSLAVRRPALPAS